MVILRFGSFRFGHLLLMDPALCMVVLATSLISSFQSRSLVFLGLYDIEQSVSEPLQAFPLQDFSGVVRSQIFVCLQEVLGQTCTDQARAVTLSDLHLQYDAFLTMLHFPPLPSSTADGTPFGSLVNMQLAKLFPCVVTSFDFGFR